MNTEKTILPCCEEEYYDTSDYVTLDFEGVYRGELTYTKWGKKHNKIAFIDLEDGRKIVVHAWSSDNNFFGFREMAYGTKLEITLKRNSRGRIFLANIIDLDEREWNEQRVCIAWGEQTLSAARFRPLKPLKNQEEHRIYANKNDPHQCADNAGGKSPF